MPLRNLPGIKNVRWIQVDSSGPITRYLAVGIGHRHPVSREIPLPLAERLIATGVPTIVKHASN